MPSPGPSAQSICANRLKGIKVLVVEDTVDIQELLMILLRAADAHVEQASNGIEGVDCALAGDHDLVLMDMQMPLMDGYEATRRLHALGYDKPILAITAFAMSGEQSQALEAGCDDHITKPINLRALMDKIESYVRPAAPAKVKESPVASG